MTQIERIKDKIEQLKGEASYHENVQSVLNKLKVYIDIISTEQPSEELEEETKLYQLDNPVINHNNSVNRPLGWTTLEEAKQLVEAGLPVETADMCYPHFIRGGADSYDANPVPCSSLDYPYEMPCWSLGALMQLLPRTIEQEYDLLINLEFWVMYKHPISKAIKAVGSKPFLIENVKDAIVWLLNNKLI